MSRYIECRRRLSDRIARVRSELDRAIDSTSSARFRDLWPAWKARLAQLAEEIEVDPEVPIALLGPTGAGKSTLINALIDAPLAPVNVAKICTASVTEVAYAEGPTYEATVEFISKQEWLSEFDAITSELSDTEAPPDAVPASERNGPSTHSKAAREKLAAVYGAEAASTARAADLRSLALPATVARAFAVGTETMTFDDPARLAENVADFLSSDGRLWPVVRRVKLRGPFPALECGATLVDLPGLNDPNEARERVTRDYLKNARFVWIVFGSKRGVTKELTDYLLNSEENILRQLVMDGRADALTLIATASDDLGDVDAAIRQYKLPADASEADAILARNADVKESSSKTLASLAAELGRRASFTHEESRLADQLADAAVFTVSARDHLRFRKYSRGRPALDEPEQTEIPSLRAHLVEIGDRYGVIAKVRRLEERLDALVAEVAQEYDAESIRLDGQSETDAPQRAEIEGALDRAHAFLGPKLCELRERLGQDLESNEEVLASKLTLAFARGRAQLDSYLNDLHRYNWNQIGAMVRRYGSYPGLSTTGEGKFDFNHGLARPVLDNIAIPFNDYFGERLRAILERWTEQLIQAAEAHGNGMLGAIEGVITPSPPMHADLERYFQNTRKVLFEQFALARNRMSDRITEVRRDMHREIPARLRENMRPVYKQAADQKGSGVKQRMVDILTRGVHQVADAMFRDAEEKSREDVRSLSDFLNRQYAEMAATVERQADQAAHNLRIGAVQLSMAEIATQRNALGRFGEVLRRLQQRPDDDLVARADASA